MSGPGKKLNADNIAYIYSVVVLHYGEPIYSCTNLFSFVSMCDCSDKDIKFSKLTICVELLQ